MPKSYPLFLSLVRNISEVTKSTNCLGRIFRNLANRENIIKTADDLAALWNAEHPDDPVTD